MCNRRKILVLCWFVLFFAGIAFAGDCSEPSDCEATTGYLTTISVLGGLTALGAGLFLQPQPGTPAWDILHPSAPPVQDVGASQSVTGSTLTDRPWPGAPPPVPSNNAPDVLQTQPDISSPTEIAPSGKLTSSANALGASSLSAPSTTSTSSDQPIAGAVVDEATIRAADIYNEGVSILTAPYGDLLTPHDATATETGGALWGAGTSFFDQYFDPENPFQTNLWKSIDAISSAEGSVLVGANPLVGLVDNALNLLGDTGLVPRSFSKDISISGILNPGIAATSSIGEGLATGDATAMNTFHQQSLNGKYGWIFQSAAEAGDYWMDNGFLTGLEKVTDGLGIDTGAKAMSGILYPGGWGGATP